MFVFLSSGLPMQHSSGGTCGQTCYLWYLRFGLSFSGVSFLHRIYSQAHPCAVDMAGMDTDWPAWATPTCEAKVGASLCLSQWRLSTREGLVSGGCCSETREWRGVRQRQQTHLHLSETVMTLPWAETRSEHMSPHSVPSRPGLP